MKRLPVILGLALLASLFAVEESSAQISDMTLVNPAPQSLRRTIPRVRKSLTGALRNRFTPSPAYTYSQKGATAQRVHEWNSQQQNSYPWHGNSNYWRWERPTALVVPPTASFMSEYNWGVGQTRSFPIYHQYGRDGGGSIGGGVGGAFSNTPYEPWSTSQFGVYPVRAPWHH